MASKPDRQARIDFARELYEELQSGNAVARRMNISHSAAYRLLNAAGIELPDRHGLEIQERKKKLHGEAAAAAAADYAAGMPLAQLEKKHGVGRTANVTAALDAGVPLRDRGQQPRRLSEEDVREIVRLYQEEGLSQMMIGAKFHLSQPYVGKVLKDHEIKVFSREDNCGERHPAWRGGRYTNKQGYVMVWIAPDDPMASMRSTIGYLAEHRLVVARWLGRPLTRQDTVHHVDGNRQNNDLSNLQMRCGAHGPRVAYECYDCGSQNVGPGKLKERRAHYRAA